MIRTVADFLTALLERERAGLPKYSEIQHPGIYGAMYEGLTQSLLNKALFENTDLRVVSGKIRNSKGALTKQIDCMVVVGDGERIPYTHDFIYPLDQVVMIVEVKKTLHAAELRDSFLLFQHFWAHVAERVALQTGLVEDAWRSLFRRNLPAPEAVRELPFQEQMVYHSIVSEACLPLRVVFAYDGFADEYALRSGFVKILEEIAQAPLEKRPRFNINTFPNLIICRTASLVKLDGMPYPGMLAPEDAWIWLASRGSQPINVLLELLWTRLAHRYSLPAAIFGEDLEVEVVNTLLAATAMPIDDDRSGWSYEVYDIPREELLDVDAWADWHPPSLTLTEFIVMNQLCLGEDIDVADPELNAFLASKGETMDGVCQRLNKAGLAAVEAGKLVLLTDECACMILPNGQYVAAENKTGRLLRYALRLTQELRKKRSGTVANAGPS